MQQGDEATAAAAAAATAACEPEERDTKRLATSTSTGPAPARPSQPASGALWDAPAASGSSGSRPAAAGGSKRKLGGGEKIEPFEAASSPAAEHPLRAAVRPRWEQTAGGSTLSGGAAVGSPAPSPYRVLSPGKAGAASLSQLPGLQFSKSRRSSAASDVTSAGSRGGASTRGAGDGGGSSGGLQPSFRRKLAAPPSRLGGEWMR